MTLGKVKGQKNQTYLCTICDPEVKLANKRDADEHADEFHRGGRIVCDLCDYVTAKSLSTMVSHRLQQHQIATEGFPSYKCPYDCKFYSHKKDQLRDHMLTRYHQKDHSSLNKDGEVLTKENVESILNTDPNIVGHV